MANDLIPTNEEIKAIEIMCKHAVDSRFLEKIGGFAGAFSIAMYAREMGLPIMSSIFGGIRPVLGKVEIAPQLMNAMIRNRGHFLQTKLHTNDACTIYGKRKDTGEDMTVSFTIEDAKRAKIYKGAWETYPKNMTYKSALSNLAKWLFPDVIGMSYVEGELDEDFNKKDAAKFDIPKELSSEVETINVIQEEMDYMSALKNKYSQHDPILIHEYCEVMASKKELPAKAFAKECLKNSALFDNYFGRWLEKRNSPKPEIAQIEPQG